MVWNSVRVPRRGGRTEEARREEEWEGEGVGTEGEGTLSGVGEINGNEDSKENRGSRKTEAVVG